MSVFSVASSCIEVSVFYVGVLCIRECTQVYDVCARRGNKRQVSRRRHCRG